MNPQFDIGEIQNPEEQYVSTIYTDMDTFESLIKEIDFFIKHHKGDIQKVLFLKAALITLNKKNSISYDAADFYCKAIANWKPDDMCLSALSLGIQAFINSLIH